MPRRRAPQAERDSFQRVAEQNRALEDESPPRSLEEMFERLETLRRQLGLDRCACGRTQDLANIEAILSAKPVLDRSCIETGAEYREVLERWRAP